MSLKKRMHAKGVARTLQVTKLIEENPTLNGFYVIVTGVKPAPEGFDNAVIVLDVDETPLLECTEMALNVSNTNRCIQFLQREYGSDDEQLLVNATIYFELRDYSKFGAGNKGLEIVRIDPGDDEHQPFIFESRDVAAKKAQGPSEAEVAAKTQALRSKREAIAQRIAAEKAASSTDAPDWAQAEQTGGGVVKTPKGITAKRGRW